MSERGERERGERERERRGNTYIYAIYREDVVNNDAFLN